jgi:hypothetical protein
MIDLVVLSGIVLGLVQLFKMASGVASRWVPLFTLAITFAIIFLYVWVKHVPFAWEFIENGFVVALGACGLWSSVKATAGQ